ncbi:MAG: phytoene desaturase [Deltaproteobacteria bacterium]|nr:phytoene desaturase [Deltaproteobacteria bacterium]
MSARPSRVVVVGGGIGGLSAAVELAHAGFDVTILEREKVTGGKARAIEVGGSLVEAGPTVLTMRWVFDELFASTGRALTGYVDLEPLDVIARHAWADGSRLDLFADRARSAEAVGELAGAAEARRYLAFCDYVEKIWRAAEGPFVLAQRASWTDVIKRIGTAGLGAMLRIDGHRTMWRALEGAFEDARLRQLFGRYATYCGASPYEAPATFNLVAHVESIGVHRVRGGISQLAAALERRAKELGASVRHGAEVRRVITRGGAASGVELADGEILDADAVLVNADVNALASGLLGAGPGSMAEAPPTPPSARSLSAMTVALVAEARGWPLAHHNVAFSDDYEGEFDAMLRARVIPQEPTVYACAQGPATGTGEEGAQRILLVVNAPATGDEPTRWSEQERARCERAAFRTLERCGLSLSPKASVLTTPVELERSYPATGGALYGPRPRGALSSFSRAGARTKVRRLYLAGGSVHPGPGVPMVALSGRLASACIREDLASTARSRAAGIVGTTSTV